MHYEDSVDFHPSAPTEDTGSYTCVECGATESPAWRSGPKGAKTLCNACGLKWKRRMQSHAQFGRRKKLHKKAQTSSASYSKIPSASIEGAQGDTWGLASASKRARGSAGETSAVVKKERDAQDQAEDVPVMKTAEKRGELEQQGDGDENDNDHDNDNDALRSSSNTNSEGDENLYKKPYFPLRSRRKRSSPSTISDFVTEGAPSRTRSEAQERRRRREREQAAHHDDVMSDDMDSHPADSAHFVDADDKLKQLFQVAVTFDDSYHDDSMLGVDQEQLEVLQQMREQVHSLTNEAKRKDQIIFDLMNKIQHSDQQMASLTQALWSSKELAQNYYALQNYLSTR